MISQIDEKVNESNAKKPWSCPHFPVRRAPHFACILSGKTKGKECSGEKDKGMEKIKEAEEKAKQLNMLLEVKKIQETCNQLGIDETTTPPLS